MKNKVIMILLILSLVFTFPAFSFATDEESSASEVSKIETPAKEVKAESQEIKQEPSQKEEIEQANPQEEVVLQEEGKVNESLTIKEETKEEIEYPFTVEYIFKYRDGSGQYKQAVYWNNKVYSANDVFKNSAKMKLCYNNYISKNLKVKVNGRMYEYAGFLTTTDGSTTIKTVNTTAGNFDTIYMYGKDYKKATTVVFEAQYKPVETFAFTATYSDQIANGGGGESHVDDGIVGYTHTFKTPADIPENYEFVYWEDDNNSSKIYWVTDDGYKENKGTYIDGEKIGVKPDTITEPTNVTIYATYKPIVTINYYDEKGTYLGSATDKAVNIYTNGEAFKRQGKFLGWYEDGQLIESNTIKELPLTREEVQTEFNVYAKYESTPAPIPKKPTPIETNPQIVNPIDPIYGMGDGYYNYNTSITNEPTPLTITPLVYDYWALLNLALALATCLLAFALIMFGISNKKDKNEDTKIKNKWLIRIATACIGIISLIVFFITEDINNPWIWIDQWTWLMAVMFIINIILVIIAKHKKEEKEEK